MKIDIIERKQNEHIDLVKFIIDGISIELANALRRTILTEIPTMAICDVLFVENDTILYDEVIAHRLALVPLTTDLKNYNLPEECSCGGVGCTLCQVEFVLDVKSDNDEKNALTKDLQSRDPKVHAVNDNMIIAKLGKHSSLVLEAYARLGIGKDHAKHQSVCSIGYKYFPNIKINNEKFENKDQMRRIMSLCHSHVLKYTDGKLELTEDYWKKCDLCESCSRESPLGAIKVDYIPEKFIFTIEGTGALPIQKIIEKAVDILSAKLDEFEEKLNKTKIYLRPEYLRKSAISQ